MTFTFAGFSVDVGTRQLRRHNEEIHVTPKAFDLLCVLLAQRPRALSKQELQDRLWPTTFVSETNLTMLVGELRTALGDDPRRPRFIRTVHRYGYAFSGPAIAQADRNRDTDAGEASYWIVSPRQQVALVVGENVIGRSPEASIWIDRADVSRRHARIVLGHDGAVLEDLGSKNGTFARGQKILAPVPLRDGDRLRFGSTTVMFRTWSGGRSTETRRRRERRILAS